MPGVFDNDPAARPVMILVVADDMVRSCVVENRPSEEPDALALLLARDVVAAVGQAGTTPSHVSIRHESLVEPLARALDAHGIGVQF